MSNTKAFIDYSMNDDGSAAREALYAEIHGRVMSAIESKKMELAGGLLTREEKSCDMDDSDDMKKAKKKVAKLKEELDIMEESGCDMDSDEYASKKKKLKKAKKKLKKIKESLQESGEVDDEGEWDNQSEEDDDSENSSEE